MAFTLASRIDALLIFSMFFKVIFIRGWQNVGTLIYIPPFSRPDTAAGHASGPSDPFLHIPLRNVQEIPFVFYTTQVLIPEAVLL